MAALFRPADPSEIDAVWPAARSLHLFASRGDFEAFYRSAPWRVQMTARGETAVLERWREHLDILGVRALWAPDREIPALIDDLESVALAQGFGRLMSPLVAREVAKPYERAGMEVSSRIVALRIDPRHVDRIPVAEPVGVVFRRAVQGDLDALHAVDGECFDEFWAYEPDRLGDALKSSRIEVAECDGRIIGYTLATVERGSGTLGRLGVVPTHRGRGVGMALLAESARYMARAGAGLISLCTQEENAASRALYARAGLRELPGRLVFLMGRV